MITKEEFFHLIKNKKIVSFDIFDTLLVRPFLRYTDIFRYIEIEYSIDGFAEERVLAERRARATIGKQEVTLDDIYQCIPKNYIFCKEKELVVEKRLLKANKLIRSYFDVAKNLGLKIICASDMYLPKSFLWEVLEKNGYEIDDLFVSCEYNDTKFSGKLFRYILMKYGITAQEIIHVGDNWISDWKSPSMIGIYSVRIPKVTENYEKKFGGEMMNSSNSLGFSVQTALISNWLTNKTAASKSYWFNIGYIFGGGLALAYVRFVIDAARKNSIDKLLFVARDGFVLKSIYDKFYSYTKIKSEYVYLSRQVVNHGGHNLLNHLKSKIGSSKRVATVDLTTTGYSAVKAIKKYFPDLDVLGMYSVTLNDYSPVPICRFFKSPLYEDNHYFSPISIEFCEFLLSSPENPIVDIDDAGNPIYDPVNGYREVIYKEI